MKALVRHYRKDKDGNPVGSYAKGEGVDDHFAHARNYSEIALAICVGSGASENIRNIV
jgi:hypothetical protein